VDRQESVDLLGFALNTSFPGRLADNLTRRCVRDDCNQYFGDTLEIWFGGENGGGVVGFQCGVRDSKSYCVCLIRKIAWYRLMHR
jgi:hypothetical protein